MAQEKEKADREADENLVQCRSGSPGVSVPSNLESPDVTILNALLSHDKIATKTAASGDSDKNNITQQLLQVRNSNAD